MQRRDDVSESFDEKSEDLGAEISAQRRRADEVREDAVEQASGTVHKIRKQADAGIERAASGVETVAGRLRETAGHYEGVPADAGTKVADTMDQTASYLHGHDSQEIVGDFQKFVRDHPLAAVAGALVGGFVLAKILR
jgi:ElaB/YqjD/DUF883 family membrane-anchored ribosome-binding protein